MALQGQPPPSPEELLSQIKDLLGQYLAMGAQTPVAPEAQQLMDAIDQTMGPGGDAGVPPDGSMPPGGPPDLGGPPPDAGPPPDMPPADHTHKTFADANVNAMDRLKKLNKKGSKA